jgi:Tfp pilus assembly protein PilV
VQRGEAGLTLVEVLVAIVVLTVGLLALVGSWAHIARAIGAGRHATVAAQAAASRLAELHRIAQSSPSCGAVEWRSGADSSHGTALSWRILDVSGPARRVELVVRWRKVSGWSADTILTAVLCAP